MTSEDNRFSGRLRRYGQVSGAAARLASQRLFGRSGGSAGDARELAAALGALKGPLMKVAQLIATIPEVVPAEYAAELSKLQAHAPPMGWPFVKRRMAAELGPDWQSKFASFEREAAAAASLGQVHKAHAHDGRLLAVKLQYPDMESAVEADLTQLRLIFAIHRRMNPAIDTSEMAAEIGERLREELDYVREARHMALYREILKARPKVVVPEVLPELSTRRLLTMTWLEGRPLLDFREAPLEARNRIGTYLFAAWWFPFSHYGVIHGDPHLGNYTVREERGEVSGLNLLDFGCIRRFRPKFVRGVVDLYEGLLHDRRDQVVRAYETWGFTGLSEELIDILNVWARFIYAPLLDDRVRSVADTESPASYGRREAFQVHKALQEKGPVKVPREFVFMDRAAIGLGAVFLHLGAELNFHRLFEETLEGFDDKVLAKRQRQAFEATKVDFGKG